MNGAGWLHPPNVSRAKHVICNPLINKNFIFYARSVSQIFRCFAQIAGQKEMSHGQT
jgi:hypothetical protein